MVKSHALTVIRGPGAALLALLTTVAALVLVLLGHSYLARAEIVAEAADHDPVILIPGMTAQASAMDPMKANFTRAGWRADRVFTWTDSQNMKGDLTRAGVEIGQKVDSVLNQTGARKAVLVTWSASTLAARSYLKNVPGAQDKVSMYFSMAGPHHGTTTAAPWCQNLYPSCKQFAIGSPWLAVLNAGTEVPGSPAVRYTALRSNCDVNVNPTTSAELAGATNLQTPTCISHFGFPSDSGVFNQIKNIIVQHETGTPPTTPTTTPPTTPPAPAREDPIIIVPGMTGDTGYMEMMKQNFISAGWSANKVFTWTDSTKMTGDLTKAGQDLGQKVDSVLQQTSSRKTVLVTWSASTLAARSYLKNVPGAQDKVSMYFSMAGPHHGTTTAAPWCQNLYPSCKQFAIGSPWLKELNSGTEVPGSPTVRYTTLRSTCDTNVDPSVSAELAGATNLQPPTCINHFMFPLDQGVFNQIKNIITTG